jgi:hypothetical protein
MLKMYAVLGLAVIASMALFVSFDWDDPSDYDTSGIAHSVRATENGYIFELFTFQGYDIRCFCREEPVELGHYAVSGDLSSDGSLFFVSEFGDLDGAGLNAARQSQRHVRRRG